MKLHTNTELILLTSAALLFCAPARQLHAQGAPQSTEKGNPQANVEAHSEESPAHEHEHDGSMPGMNMEDDKGNHAQAGAMHSMTHGHHMDSAHMRMTPARQARDEDRRRADE